MLNVLWWFLIVEAVGLAVFPLAFFLFPRLKDRGFSVTKPLGMLIIGYLSWILSVLHVVPSIQITLWVMLIVVACACWFYGWKRRAEILAFVRRERTALIAAEAIFIIVFAGWVIFRFFDPYINHTEQPMDHALLNASIRSSFGHPEDPWLRGESVSYYYFGYWMMGALSQLTGIASNYSYNLSLALIPALGSAGVFGIVYGMVRSQSRRLIAAVGAGFASALLLGVVSNLAGVLEFMRFNGMGSQGFWSWIGIDQLDGPAESPPSSWAPDEFWWWFRSTRIINTFVDGQGLDYTIQEFPFFSFLLGDMHPHVMSIPFVALFIAAMWDYFLRPLKAIADFGIREYVHIGFTGLLLGGLAFTNMWDLPTFWALFAGLTGLKAYRDLGGGLSTIAGAVVPVAGAALAVALLLFLPYFLAFRGGVTGVGTVETDTRAIHMFIVWGLFFTIVAPFVIRGFWDTTVDWDWRRITVIALGVGFVPYAVWLLMRATGDGDASVIARFVGVMPLAALIAIACYNAMWLTRRNLQAGKAFAMVIAALGLMMIMGPELLYVRDSFDSRMNTVFKLYYQAWILLSIASGFAFYYWLDLRGNVRGWRRSLSGLWAAAVVLLLLGSLYYPAAAIATKSELNSSELTLDGLEFMRRNNPAEYAAIMYLQANAPAGSAIVESVGEWFDNGLISRSTGIPTVFNWPGHELQWRGGAEQFAGREQDVATIYTTTDASEARNLLAKYNVDYVYIGPRERQKHGEEGIAKFSEFMDEVFSQGEVVIFRMR